MGKLMNKIAYGDRMEWLFYAGVLVALLPVIIFRDFTPDNELRYLSITDEALRNHDIFAFYNHGAPYADKPPLYFWFTMACRLIAGRHCMWLLALGSILPAFGVIAVMRRWAAEHMDMRSSRVAMMMLMTSAYFLGAAVILRMDMLMCLFIVLSLRTFWKIRSGVGKNRDVWLFPVYLFLALFTKGPLGILIPLVSTIVFLLMKGEIRNVSFYWGWRTWLVLLSLCSAWFLGVFLDGGKEYLDNLLFHQTMDRAVNAFHHKRPFYYYLVAMWYVIAPWSLYVIGAVAADLRHPSRLPSLQQFFITVGIATVVLLSCISSKLQIYMLPAVPFLVYAAMMSLPKYSAGMLTRIAIAFPSAVFVTVLPALLVCSRFGLTGTYMSASVVMAASFLTAGGVAGLVMLRRRGIGASVMTAGIALFAALFAGGWALRDFNSGMGYGALCREARSVAESEGIDDIYVWKIRRAENMDVYFGKEVKIIEGDSVPDTAELGGGLLLVRDKDAGLFGGCGVTEVWPYAIVNTKQQ